LKILETKNKDFDKDFNLILNRAKLDTKEATLIVSNIIENIIENGDEALFDDIEKFDNWRPKDSFDLKISTEDTKKSYDNLDSNLKQALHKAYDRITSFHKKQIPKSWIDKEANGSLLGQKITPIESAGLYIPGGKAAYPSSLLMNAIPAIVAGVKNIIICTPTPDNRPNELLLAACHLCKITQIYKVGGASAIGAMAYGTQTIPKVDVITGPGNIFVATAKKLVYGDVNIDMIAGPSEIGIIADEFANPKYIAIDLLSQAEHDQMASSILITTSKKIAQQTKLEIDNFLQNLKRSDIAKISIKNRGSIIVCEDLAYATNLMNQIAPEHLEILIQNPEQILDDIKHAGAIFLGEYTPEAIGDYIAGPNHTLPTGGTAKFYSPLGVENFIKKSSIIKFSKQGINELAKDCAMLAKAEGLTAHEQSVLIRLDDSK
jgi:histidinol dehydrogenase